MTQIHHLPQDATAVARFAERRAALRAEMIDADPYLAAAARGRGVRQVPLSMREMIPDATLRRWSEGEAEAQVGEISPELQQELAMLLPDLCLELLAHRALADLEGRG